MDDSFLSQIVQDETWQITLPFEVLFPECGVCGGLLSLALPWKTCIKHMFLTVVRLKSSGFSLFTQVNLSHRRHNTLE